MKNFAGIPVYISSSHYCTITDWASGAILIIPANLELSQRLERAEGKACVQFAAARLRLFPDCDSKWIESGGTIAVFDGIGSPVTQCFGLGLFEEASAATMDEIENFFLDRKSSVMHELSPLAGVKVVEMLCNRNYKPIEMSNVLYRSIDLQESSIQANIIVRTIAETETQLWTDISARAWSYEHPELSEFYQNLGVISSARENCICFLAELDGKPAATGAICVNDGIALLAGAATIPEYRGRGLQGALFQERMRWAAINHCDLAAVVAEPGSSSQRNAQRHGFHIAYTRTKWCLSRLG